jgi:hypothetical protein
MDNDGKAGDIIIAILELTLAVFKGAKKLYKLFK